MTKRLLCLSLMAAAAIAAPDRKIARDLESAGDGQMSVIIQFTSVPSSPAQQAVRVRGGILATQLAGTTSLLCTIPASAAADIAALPGVAYIAANREVRAHPDYSTNAVDAVLAWKSGFSGQGIGIAVIDSGISRSPDLTLNNASRVVYSESFLELNQGLRSRVQNGSSDTWDRYGHGTHVAGIAAGDGTAGNGRYQGLAPKCSARSG